MIKKLEGIIYQKEIKENDWQEYNGHYIHVIHHELNVKHPIVQYWEKITNERIFVNKVKILDENSILFLLGQKINLIVNILK